jgi:hypothetical protein
LKKPYDIYIKHFWINKTMEAFCKWIKLNEKSDEIPDSEHLGVFKFEDIIDMKVKRKWKEFITKKNKELKIYFIKNLYEGKQ